MKMKYSIIKISNKNTFFYVIASEVKIGKNKNKSFVIINGKKIYNMSRAEFIKEIEL